MKKTIKLISFGEILFDIVGGKTLLGGAPLNFASHFTNLGGESFMLSAVGEDILGEAALAHLDARNISASLITRSKKETGKCLVTLDENAIPSYNILKNVAYDEIKANTDKIKDISADVLYFGTLSQRSENNRATLKDILEKITFSEVFCDLNIRKDCSSEESVLFCLVHATILKYSDDSLEEETLKAALGTERENIPKEIAKRFPNIKIILRTLGEKGSEIYDIQSGNRIELKAVENPTPVSTVGAGDSYAAAFLFHFLSGDSLYKAGTEAAKLASYVVGIEGAI